MSAGIRLVVPATTVITGHAVSLENKATRCRILELPPDLTAHLAPRADGHYDGIRGISTRLKVSFSKIPRLFHVIMTTIFPMLKG